MISTCRHPRAGLRAHMASSPTLKRQRFRQYQIYFPKKDIISLLLSGYTTKSSSIRRILIQFVASISLPMNSNIPPLRYGVVPHYRHSNWREQISRSKHTRVTNAHQGPIDRSMGGVLGVQNLLWLHLFFGVPLLGWCAFRADTSSNDLPNLHTHRLVWRMW